MSQRRKFVLLQGTWKGFLLLDLLFLFWLGGFHLGFFGIGERI
jgi:hypothetical protein